MSSPARPVPLSEVLQPISRREDVDPEKTYNILGARWYAKGLYTKDIRTGAQVQAKYLYLVEEGDFVYNRLFAWKGSFAVATAENNGCYVSNEFPCFAIVQTKADPRYLAWYFQRASAWNEALGLSAGGTPTSRNRLKEEKLLGMRFPLPSVDEQQRIVGRVDELAQRINEAISVRERSNAAVNTLARAYAQLQFDALDLERKPLHSLATHVTKGTTPKTYGHSFVEDGIPFLRVEDVQNGDVRWRDTPFSISEDTDQFMARSRAYPGDVLVTIAGTIGRSAVVPDDAPRLNMNQAVAVVRPCPVLSPRFLSHFIRSAEGQKQLRVQTVASAISNISLTTIRNLRIPSPPLEQQQQIVDRIERLEGYLSKLRPLQLDVTNGLDALLPSVLDRAFSGAL